MEQESKYKYLAKNTLLFTLSSFGSKILVFLLVPIYTSILSTADYGIADIITTSATLFGYIFTINIADSVLRFTIDSYKDQFLFLSFGLQVLVAGTAIFGVVLTALSSISAIMWEKYYYLFLLLHFFGLSVYQIYSNYLRAIDKVKQVAISGIISTVVTITLNILLLFFFKMGIIGYLISMVSGNIIAAIYCAFNINKSPLVLLKTHVDKTIKKDMMTFSIPLIFNGVAWWMNTSIDRYFVTGICGAAWNGIYAVSYKIPTILTVFHSIFSQAWNLSAIKEFDKDDSDGFFSNTYSLYNASLIIVCSILVLINIPLASLLFAKDFFIAWKYSSVLLVSNVFSALAGFLGSIFTAVKDSKIFAVSTVFSAILNCILNLILIPLLGVQGAAIATCISFFMIWLIRLICTRKYIKWHINLAKDVTAYLLIAIQVFIEHTEGHFYIGQLFILLALILLYREQFIIATTILSSKIYSAINKN